MKGNSLGLGQVGLGKELSPCVQYLPHLTRQKLSPLGTPALLWLSGCVTFLTHTAVGDRLV